MHRTRISQPHSPTPYDPETRKIVQPETPIFEPESRIPTRATPKSYLKRFSISTFSGNEVYYTACSLLVILTKLCSNFRYQKTFKLKVFHVKSGLGDAAVRDSDRGGAHRRRILLCQGVSETRIPRNPDPKNSGSQDLFCHETRIPTSQIRNHCVKRL